MLLLGNGSDELVQMVLDSLRHARCCGADANTDVFDVSFGGTDARSAGRGSALDGGLGLDMPQMLAAIAREQPRVTFLATPNNPTANCFDDAAVRQLIEVVPG